VQLRRRAHDDLGHRPERLALALDVLDALAQLAGVVEDLVVEQVAQPY